MDKEDAFWIGNCIGIVALLATIFFLAPVKQKEREAYQLKQKELAAQAHVQAATSQKILVVAAKREITVGEKIGADSLTTQALTKIDLSPNMSTDLKQFVGKVAGKQIAAGKPILKTDLKEPAAADN